MNIIFFLYLILWKYTEYIIVIVIIIKIKIVMLEVKLCLYKFACIAGLKFEQGSVMIVIP